MTATLVGQWTVDAANTSAEVVAKNFMVRQVRAQLDVASGSATIAEDLASSQLEVTLIAASFDTGNPKRDDHVRSDDFLDADEYPSIMFRSTSIVPTGDDYAVAGDLTVGDTTTQVTVDIKVGAVADDRAEFRATTWVDRHSIGVGKLPTLVIGRTLAVTVDGVATRD